MIKNEQERKITLLWIEKFKSSVEYIKNHPEDYPEWLNKLQIESLESEIVTLENEIKEYYDSSK